MFGRRRLQDSVSEIEDIGSLARRAKDALDLGFHRPPAKHENLRIEIALDAAAQTALKLLRGPA